MDKERIRKATIYKSIRGENFKRVVSSMDDVIFNMLDSRTILAGGALRRIWNPEEKLIDYDIFFLTATRERNGKSIVPNDVAIFYDPRAIIQEKKLYLEKEGFKLIYECPEGFLYTYLKNIAEDRDDPVWIKVQLICEHIYQSIEDLLGRFDIKACMLATDGINLYYTAQAIQDIKKKHINLNNLTHTAATIKRIIKYSKKGYYIDSNNILKLMHYLEDKAIDRFIDSGDRSRSSLSDRLYID